MLTPCQRYEGPAEEGKGRPDPWFPTMFNVNGEELDANGAEHFEQAKFICRAYCLRIAECQKDAIERVEPHGVWGGLDPKERRKVQALIRKRVEANRFIRTVVTYQ